MQQNGNEKYFHFQFQQKSSIWAIPNHAWKLKLKHVFPFQFLFSAPNQMPKLKTIFLLFRHSFLVETGAPFSTAKKSDGK
jgi:hypothetical protein